MSRPLAQPPRLGEPGAVVARLELWFLSLGYVLLAVPVLVMLCLLTTSLSVAVVGVGLALLFLLVPLNEALADVHRKLSGRVLGRPVERGYLPTDPSSWWGTLRVWVSDPARWRDFGWTYAVVCVGWAISWVALGLGLAVAWYAVFPFIYWVTPDGLFDLNYLGVFAIDTQAKSFLEWGFLLVAVPLWWYGTPFLMRLRAQLDESLLAPPRATLEARVAQVTESRAQTVDHSASEIRRIERDLHDGAQARLVSLGMSLGMAEQMIRQDPERALALIDEARNAATSALGDLRTVVRGIHPPVLADRGLAGAVHALALDLAIPVHVLVDLPGRAPAPVESAAYFAVNECLANVVKHSGATQASVEITHDGGSLRMLVGDDGIGGADPSRGSGLLGMQRRLAAFDGTMVVQSPGGGPTTIAMEIPCALSSPRTTPSSGTD